MKEFTQINTLHQLIEEHKLLLIFFYLKNCSTCQAIEPELNELSDQIRGLVSYKIPVDEYPEIVQEQSVFSTPTVVVYAERREVLREVNNFTIDETHHKLDRILMLMGI